MAEGVNWEMGGEVNWGDDSRTRWVHSSLLFIFYELSVLCTAGERPLDSPVN